MDLLGRESRELKKESKESHLSLREIVMKIVDELDLLLVPSSLFRDTRRRLQLESKLPRGAHEEIYAIAGVCEVIRLGGYYGVYYLIMHNLYQ